MRQLAWRQSAGVLGLAVLVLVAPRLAWGHWHFCGGDVNIGGDRAGNTFTDEGTCFCRGEVSKHDKPQHDCTFDPARYAEYPALQAFLTGVEASATTAGVKLHRWHGPIIIDTYPPTIGDPPCDEQLTGPFDITGWVAVIPHHLAGDKCSDWGSCLDLFCVDIDPATGEGYCCNSPCGASRSCPDAMCGGNRGADAPTCGRCNQAGSLGTCVIAAADTECRAAVSECDVRETCPGGTDPLVASFCPADALEPASKACGPTETASDCFKQDFCAGTSADCVDSGYWGSTKTCRAQAGVCDVADVCPGGSPSCPADVMVERGMLCDPLTGSSCTGDAVSCPEKSPTMCGA